MTTVSEIVAGLLPVMFSNAIGIDVMKRIAAPLIGGMATAPILSLFIIRTVYPGWQEKLPKKGNGHAIRMESA